MKKVSEVFSDHKLGKNICDAIVEKAVLKKIQNRHLPP